MMKKLINRIFGKKEKPKYDLLDATNYKPSIEEIKHFTTRWNLDFPIDRWWRRKHSVAFNSPIHREVSFIDMRIEWEEDKLFDRVYSDQENEYELDSGEYMKEVDEKELTPEQAKKEALDEFLNTDLSKFDDK